MELFGLKNKEERVVKIGKTFRGGSTEFYHTFRYDFKPASIDTKKCGSMEVEEKEVAVTVPLLEGHGGPAEAVYKGSKTPASKDYILVIDHKTGEITLERVGYHIRVKRTRVERKSQARLSPYQRQSPLQGLPSATNRSPNKPSPRQSPNTVYPNTNKAAASSSSQKPQMPQPLAPGSMPIFPFEVENKAAATSTPTAYNHSIMSDSDSSDSDSNSGSSSSSDSDSDSEPETPRPQNHINGGMPDPKVKNGYSHSPNILDDLNLSEED